MPIGILAVAIYYPHWTYRIIFPKIDIHLRQLCPRHKLARSTIDSLLRELERPICAAFALQEVDLSV